jgi:hypothetical protein
MIDLSEAPELLTTKNNIISAAHEDDRVMLEHLWEVVDQLPIVEAEAVRQRVREKLIDKDDEAGYRWYSLDYERGERPLPFEEWIKSKEHTGALGKDFWPVWQQEIGHVTDQANGICEWYVTGCIGGGKTYSTLVAQIYKGPYICSCLKNPQKFFGIADNSEIVFGLFNAILTNAVQVDFNQATRFLKDSDYFKKHCPAFITPSKCIINWPSKEMTMRVGSGEMHVLGANLFSYLVDEVNFMKTPMGREDHEHQAHKIYHHASRRLKSRFQKLGVTPGLACIVSSRLATSSFLEKLMEQNKGDPTTFVSDFALWESKGRDNFAPGMFRVACGSKYRKSEILDKVDTSAGPNTFTWITQPGGEPPPPGMKIVKVPNDFIFDFQRDMDGSLRDIAGVPTHGVSSLIHRTECVLECVDRQRKHPFLKESHELALKDDNAVLVNLVQWRDLAKIVDGAWVPYAFPGEPRFIHVDLGLTGDCAALAMGCAYSKYVHAERDIETGQPTETFMSKVHVDMMLRITPTKGDQIDIQKILDFIQNLHNYGYWVQRVTFDGFASEMAIQQLLKASLLPPRHLQNKKSADEVVKLESYVQSVDREDTQYRLLRDMLHANAVSYYHYQPVIDEVLDLEHDIRKTAEGRIKGKVDHPEGGSKDVADALCGMVWGVATAKTQGGSEPTEDTIGDGPPDKLDLEAQLNADIVSDYADASRIKALIPHPTPVPPPRPIKRGRKILTKKDWQRELGRDGFGRHRM